MPEAPDKTVSSQPGGSILRNMLRGAGLGLLLRWSKRLIGLVSIMILARLLTPTEIGVVALAMLLMGLLQTFQQIGIAMLLIRKPEIDRADCDTAWTMGVVLGIVIASIMVVLAPAAASYFDEERVVNITYVLALSMVIGAFTNIGMVLARRDLDFGKDFRFHIALRLLTFLVTVFFAFWLRNAWAIVYGVLATSIFDVLLSFKMHEYRPRLCLARYREYLRFSVSIVPMNIGQYLLGKIDAWIVGGIEPTNKFVAYNMSSDLSGIFTQQIVGAISRGQYPNYSKIRDQSEKLAIAFMHEISAVSTFVLPVGIGLAMVAENAVPVLLGPQWTFIITLLPWLAVYKTMSALTAQMTGQILVATGHERLSAAFMWVRLLILAPLLYLAGQNEGVEGVAKMIVVVGTIVFPLGVYALVYSGVISALQIAHALWRPTLATAIMALVLAGTGIDWADLAFVRLVLDTLLGALVYFASLISLWYVAGRPDGPERLVVGFVLSRRPARRLES